MAWLTLAPFRLKLSAARQPVNSAGSNSSIDFCRDDPLADDECGYRRAEPELNRSKKCCEARYIYGEHET